MWNLHWNFSNNTGFIATLLNFMFTDSFMVHNALVSILLRHNAPYNAGSGLLTCCTSWISKRFSLPSRSVIWVLCCLLKPVSVWTFSVMYDHTYFFVVFLQITTAHISHKWNALSTWWLNMATLIFLRGFCEYEWVNILTLLSTNGRTFSSMYCKCSQHP